MGYRYKLLKIRLKCRWKLLRLYLAGKCLRSANRLSPDLMANYDKAVVDQFLLTGRIGLKF
jgi:hypothetical protein